MASELLKTIQKISLDAYLASYPPKIYTGVVQTVEDKNKNTELTIRLSEDNITVGSAYLLLSDEVVDRKTYFTYDNQYFTEYGGGETTHLHELSKGINWRVTIHNGLKVGEEVLLMRILDGKKFVVLTRVHHVDE